MRNALNTGAKHSAAAQPDTLPTSAQLKRELRHERYKNRYLAVLRSTVFTLVIVAAIAILVATLWLPVLQIYGTSMTPTLTDGDIVFTLKSSEFSTGDVLAFYYNNKILVKRVIAGPGDWVDIDDEGNVYVNGEAIDEPYLVERALGECDIKLPYQVPDSRWFVMGDHRSTSVDSRSTTVGCVAQEQVVGRVLFRVWPLGRLGTVG
jgi:signal peptidase I